MPNNMAVFFEVEHFLTPEMCVSALDRKERQDTENNAWTDPPYKRVVSEDGLSIIETRFYEYNGLMLDRLFEVNTTPMATQLLTGVAPRSSRNGFDPSLATQPEEVEA